MPGRVTPEPSRWCRGTSTRIGVIGVGDHDGRSHASHQHAGRKVSSAPDEENTTPTVMDSTSSIRTRAAASAEGAQQSQFTNALANQHREGVGDDEGGNQQSQCREGTQNHANGGEDRGDNSSGSLPAASDRS